MNAELDERNSQEAERDDEASDGGDARNLPNSLARGQDQREHVQRNLGETVL